jgi:hypothetical protein
VSHAAPAPLCRSHKYYLLSCEDYDRLVERAQGRCELCGVPGAETPHGMLHIDHDPARGNGAVRGLLCSRCNTRLGRGLLPSHVADAWLAAPLFKITVWTPRLKVQGASRQVRIPDDVWARFEVVAGRGKRSAVIVELIRWYLGEDGGGAHGID